MTLTEIDKAVTQIKDDWRKKDRAAAVGREHIVMTDFIRALSKGEVKATVIALGAKAILEAIEMGDHTTEARVMPQYAPGEITKALNANLEAIEALPNPPLKTEAWTGHMCVFSRCVCGYVRSEPMRKCTVVNFKHEFEHDYDRCFDPTCNSMRGR